MLVVEVQDKKYVKQLKTLLESYNGNSLIKPIKTTDIPGSIAGGNVKVFQLKTSITDIDELQKLLAEYKNSVSIAECADFEEVTPTRTMKFNPSLLDYIRGYLKEQNSFSAEFIEDVIANHCSSKYSLYPPLILFNHSPIKQMFVLPVWEDQIFRNSNERKTDFFAKMIQQVFIPSNSQNGVAFTHIAVNNPIQETDNIWRKPLNITPLFGDLSSNDVNFDYPALDNFEKAFWCSTVQNGIYQEWAPIYTMFSRGNIKEKARILDTEKTCYFKDIANNDVLDMYCGIGYFTLSYLKRHCRHLFGFDLNPWSCEGLRRGLASKKNAKFVKQDFCHIFNESNEFAMQRLDEYEVSSMSPADNNKKLRIRHINMGLLPTSEPGWAIALDVAYHFHGSCSVTTLHVHENIHDDDIKNGSFVNKKLLPALLSLKEELQYESIDSISVTHVEKIKTFAPDVWHVCIDTDIHFKCTAKTQQQTSEIFKMSAYHESKTTKLNKLPNSSNEQVQWSAQEKDIPAQSSSNQNFIDWTDINTDDQNLYSKFQKQDLQRASLSTPPMQVLSSAEQNYLKAQASNTDNSNDLFYSSDGRKETSELHSESSKTFKSLSPVTTPTFNIIPPLEAPEFEKEPQQSNSQTIRNVPNIVLSSSGPTPHAHFSQKKSHQQTSKIFSGNKMSFENQQLSADNFSNRGYIDSTMTINNFSQNNLSSSPLLQTTEFARNDLFLNPYAGNTLHPTTSNESSFVTANDLQNSPRLSVLEDPEDVLSLQNSPHIPALQVEDFSSNENLLDNFLSLDDSLAVPKNQDFESFLSEEELDRMINQSLSPARSASVQGTPQEITVSAYDYNESNLKRETSPNMHLLSPKDALFDDSRRERPRSRSISKNSSTHSRSRSISRDRSKIEQLENDLSVGQNSLNQTFLENETPFSKNNPNYEVEKPESVMSHQRSSFDNVHNTDLSANAPLVYEVDEVTGLQFMDKADKGVFSCLYCDKYFPQAYNLKSHLKSHTDIKPFKCSHCDKSFARQHDRKRHENLHSGQKWYICGGFLEDGTQWGCGKQFARSDALGRHLKTKAGKRCLVPLYDEFSRSRFLRNPDKEILVQNLDSYLDLSVKLDDFEFENTVQPLIEHNFLKLAQKRAHVLKNVNK
ncbi:hypothetical protein ACO0QE_001227 [Hanseniaspora vineae]